jgi:serine/threonine protein kinase
VTHEEDKKKPLSIRNAMDGFAPTGGMWEKGVWMHDDQLSYVGRQASLLSALYTVQAEAVRAGEGGSLSDGAAQEAVERYWVTCWSDREYPRVSEERVIHRGKDRDSYVTQGEMNGAPVIVKHAHADVLRRELAILSAVAGRGVPRVYGFDMRDQESLLFIEYLKADSLSKTIGLDKDWNSKPVDQERAVAISLGLIDALRCIGEAGYLYRDLSPDHIMIDEEGGDTRVRLIDVESSVLKDEHGVAHIETERDTWETMAPEEFTFGTDLTEATSVYAVGCIMAQLMTGKSHFHVDNVPGFDAKQLREEAKYVHTTRPDLTIEGQLGDVVRRALSPNPKDRPQSLAELADIIRHAR